MATTKLKLFLITANLKATTQGGVSPFRTDHYNVVLGQVISAENEKQCREIAMKNSADEVACYQGIDTWLDEKFTTVVELKPGKEAGLILRDYSKMGSF